MYTTTCSVLYIHWPTQYILQRKKWKKCLEIWPKASESNEPPGMPLSHCKVDLSHPLLGNVVQVGGLPAEPERISALPALTSLAQSCCPQLKLIFSCTLVQPQRMAVYIWLLSFPLTGHRGHSAWLSCPF